MSLAPDQEKKHKKRPSKLFWLLAILLSLTLHYEILYKLGKNSEDLSKTKTSLPQGYIKFDVPKKESKKPDEPKDEKDDETKRILEAPLTPNEAPPDADFLGQTDHTAKKKMKVKPRLQEKAADPGQSRPMVKAAQRQEPSHVPKGEDVPEDKSVRKGPGPGELMKKKGREGYDEFLSASTKSLDAQEMNQGYMDHLNDLVEEGETIDMNTREYRFIGYFTGLRKAIELVWVYPSEAAQRGFYGQVIVKFIILPDGKLDKVKVLESSGYNILDSAIVDAIRSASPFSPLPKTFNKDRLVVKGAFNYILNAY